MTNKIHPLNIISEDYNKHIKTNDNPICDVCPICFDDLTENGIISLEKCNHKYHNKCIDEWFLRSDTCPVCRENVKNSSKPYNVYLDRMQTYSGISPILHYSIMNDYNLNIDRYDILVQREPRVLEIINQINQNTQTSQNNTTIVNNNRNRISMRMQLYRKFRYYIYRAFGR